MDKPLHKPPSDLAPFEVGEVFQVSDRGAVALPADEPHPWWPLGTHRVRIAPPAGDAFEAEAYVEGLHSREGGARMALLLMHVRQPDVPAGSRIVSLGYTPRPSPPPAKRWWQVWR